MGNSKATVPAWQRTILAAAVGVAIAATAQAKGDSDRDFEISTLSSRADTVTAGDVVVEVHLPSYARPSDVIVRLNGEDVTSSFTAVAGSQGSFRVSSLGRTSSLLAAHDVTMGRFTSGLRSSTIPVTARCSRVRIRRPGFARPPRRAWGPLPPGAPA